MKMTQYIYNDFFFLLAIMVSSFKEQIIQLNVIFFLPPSFWYFLYLEIITFQIILPTSIMVVGFYVYYFNSRKQKKKNITMSMI